MVTQIVIELDGDGIVFVGHSGSQGSGGVAAASEVGHGHTGEFVVGVEVELIQSAFADEYHFFGQVVLPVKDETVVLGVLDQGRMSLGIVTHEEDQLVTAAFIVESHSKTVIQTEIAAVLLFGVEIVVVGITQISLGQPHAGGDVVNRLRFGEFGLSHDLLTLLGGRLLSGGGSGGLDLLLGGLLRGLFLLLCTAVQRKKGETKRHSNDRIAFHHAPPL